MCVCSFGKIGLRHPCSLQVLSTLSYCCQLVVSERRLPLSSFWSQSLHIELGWLSILSGISDRSILSYNHCILPYFCHLHALLAGRELTFDFLMHRRGETSCGGLGTYALENAGSS